MSTPIFFDPTGRRGRRAKRGVGALIVAILVAALGFATTLVAVPREQGLSLPWPQARAAKLAGAARQRHHRHGLAAWLPAHTAADPHSPLSIGFYMPGDDASIASLRRNIGALDWVVPALVSVGGPAHRLATVDDTRFEATIAAAGKDAPKVLPMIQNLTTDSWDIVDTVALLHHPAARAALAVKVAGLAAGHGAGGLVLDFEGLPAAAMDDYLSFLHELRVRMPKGALLAITVPAGDPDWPLARLGRAADRVILMAYDYHWQGGEPGAIAPQDWFLAQVTEARRLIGPGKLVVALGSYAYDWHSGGGGSGGGAGADGTEALAIDDAWLAAHDSAARIIFDPASGNAGFAYDEAGQHHNVWMLDAATSWNQLATLRRLGLDDVALWRLGSEDPDFWGDLAAFRAGTRPDLSRPRALLSTDVEGSGEILRITSSPSPGRRTLGFDASGLIRRERYDVLPTPYVVERGGGSDPKLLALTFDDGPDASWTPRILSILEAAHVPATFFVVGENALQHPGLLSRIVEDGGEIGNHTYTHPNLANASAEQTRLELNITQRLVEAYTGRRMTLFRAPYFGDAEPTTTDELGPALTAQDAGYTVVGLHVDPGDWKRPGVDTIIGQTLDQVRTSTADRSGNVILLHDGGGDRSETVAALPRIIATLKARGYRFVTASQLIGVPQAAAMPVVTGSDLLAVRVDIAIFVILAAISLALGWIFYLAVTLGVARAVTMTALAWWQSRQRRPAPPVFEPSVSVIIPAFNEERVIAGSVARVLASDYPGLQVIVVDDGSKDRTSAIIREQFAGDPRVTLLTLANGGKAAALNRALADATGAVIIALDADTQFETTTIRRLARWFVDPALGAVAGDARVGNRVNLVTRWQAVEYITAQNLERRALAGFDAMTVVPGAVGAWRREALEAVGGYPENTLAEDQDLTVAVQRAGWRVTYDPRAVAWTEAPESFRGLAKQRYRWAFGTLQCLWKHRAILRLRKPSGLALVGLPQAWLFQIVFAAISPLIDLALVLSLVDTVVRVEQHGWAQTSGDVGMMAAYWLGFTAIDVICGWLAYRLDGGRTRYPPHLLVAQRLVYRQIMYWVVLRAIASAIGGWMVGWGKLERSGRVGEVARQG